MFVKKIVVRLNIIITIAIINGIHPAEASALAVAAKGSHQQHGEHGDEGRANACTGAPHHGEVLPVFWGAGHGGDHGPVRNIHHGIGDRAGVLHFHERNYPQ